MAHSHCQSGTRELAVGRLDDFGGVPHGMLPDVSVGVGECALGGVQASGYRGTALDRDGLVPGNRLTGATAARRIRRRQLRGRH